jgi:hypothetical protein
MNEDEDEEGEGEWEGKLDWEWGYKDKKLPKLEWIGNFKIEKTKIMKYNFNKLEIWFHKINNLKKH